MISQTHSFAQLLYGGLPKSTLEGEPCLGLSSRQCTSLTLTAGQKLHKPQCTVQEHKAELDPVANNPLTRAIAEAQLPSGVTLHELDERLARWVKFHQTTMGSAAIHALGLPKDLARTKTHVLHLILSARTDHGDRASKIFRVVDAKVYAITKARSRSLLWAVSLNNLDQMRKEGERVGAGTTTGVFIECPPLGVQVVPWGSLKNDISRWPLLPDWKNILQRDVENGKRFTRFGDN